MGLMMEQGGAFDEYEAIALPRAPHLGAGSLGSAVFLRRSARPSRRAVLHLHDLAGSFAPADLASWYNERGFHFYVTDLDTGDPFDAPRRRPGRTASACFAALDAACGHLREADGIDAIILSAQEHAAAPAAAWCHARRASNPVDALILANPEFGRGPGGTLDIACPVLVIAAAGPRLRAAGRRRRGPDGIRLGQHVTWLHVESGPGAAGPDRRRLFDEMGRWLGAYMYGKVRDQLL
ncbi:MAG: hypothetical protein ACR2FU_05070 [Streptosporangiaceae bacterium]